MGKKIIPTTIAVREKYTYFLSDYCNYIENDRIEEKTKLGSTNNSVDSFDCHVL